MHVVREVAVDQLRGSTDGSPDTDQHLDVRQAGAVVVQGFLAPRDPVRPGPRVVTTVQERRSRAAVEVPVERASGGHDLAVLLRRRRGAGLETPGGPPLDDEAALLGPDGRSDADVARAVDRREDARLPLELLHGHVERLEHEAARPPHRALPTVQGHERP